MTSAFEKPWMLWLLGLIPALAALYLLARGRNQQAGLAFGEALMTRPRRASSWRGPALLLAGLTLLGLGMAGPRWGRDWSRSAAPGRDVMIVLDVSRSMFAEAPSRLEQAREALKSLCDGLRFRGGHRLGLVVFAGRAEVACPLTHDLDHFLSVVESLDTGSPPPGLGVGTRIGAGIAQGLSAFEGRGREGRDMILISDGDDPQRDGEYRGGAQKARDEGVQVHCLAVGSPEEPRRIPHPDGGWVMDGDRPALTALEEAPLREIAQRTGGKLLRLGSGPIDLAAHYLQWARESVDVDSPDHLPSYHQRQGWLLWPALALLLLTFLLPESRP
jgi:Ca-activated chloride channel family protein